MNRFSIRILSVPESSLKARKALSVFAHHHNATEEQLDSHLMEILPQETFVNEARFVGSSECVTLLEGWLKSNSITSSRLESATEDFKENAKLICFDAASGDFISRKLTGELDPNSKVTIASERRASLVDMFKKSGGMMSSTNGFHYVKPSKKHVNEFLRASNVLESGENSYIIAFWLLPYIWKKPIRQIIVDTSGISSIAHILAYEALRLGGLSALPTISSHKSYGGLDTLNIVDPEGTLILMSASTSGGLYQELLAKGAKPENLVTLFYLGEHPSEVGNTLCDLTKHEIENSDGLHPIINYPESECPECKKKSFPIKLEGDQFTLEPPKVEEVLIARDDLPKEQRDTLDKLAGTDVFKVFRNLEQRQLEIFLDISSLFPAEISEDDSNSATFLDIKNKYKAMSRRGLPVHLKRIIHANYPFSEDLAIAAEGVLKDHSGASDSSLISSRDLRKTNPPQPDTASLVVIACMDDAHELMSINRDLRAIQPNGNTTYIAPIFRASSKGERNRIRSSLTFGENGPNTFNLYTMIDIDLPECARNNSWKRELDCLHKVIDWADLNEKEIPDDLMTRIELLRDAPARGLSNGLFWKNPKGFELKIRPDFTLINVGGVNRKLSQADVYVAVSALLLNLRSGVKGKHRLSHRPYEWVVLSPENFQRFNDGVIQAALLRAARDYELVFSSDEKLSERLKELILAQIKNLKEGHEDGEALMEFLLAMLMQKLVLFNTHTSHICREILSVSALPNHFHLVAEYLLANFPSV